MSNQSLILQKVFFVISIVILLLSILIPILSNDADFAVKAEAGKLDASTWNTQQQKVIRLDGQWQFVWKQIVEPEVFQKEPSFSTGFIQVPSAWTFLKVDNQRLDLVGFATYRLQVTLPSELNDLGIRIGNIRNAHRLYINGQLLQESGKVSSQSNQVVQFTLPYAEYFHSASNQLDIVIQVASNNGYTSGINQTIYLGTHDGIKQMSLKNITLDISLAAIFFAFAIFFLFFFFQRRSNLEMLFFSLFCLSSVLYTLSSSERLIAQFLPDFSYSTYVTILYVSSIATFYFFCRYIYSIIAPVFPKKLIYVIDGLSGVNVILYFFVEDKFPYLYFYAGMLFAILVAILGYILKAIRTNVTGVYYIAAIFMGVIFMIVMSSLSVIWYLDTYFFLPTAPLVVILSQALFISQAFTSNYQYISQMKDKLTQLDQLKDDFLAKTSHELRTPLNGIINISQSIMEGITGPISEKQSYEIKLVRDLGKRLSYLVNDILDFSKAKHTQLVLNRKPTDLHGVIVAILDIFSRSLSQQSIQLIHRIRPGEHILDTDENRLHQILFNLVENALKHTQSGYVEITALAQDEKVWISVQDTGKGIPPERIQDVFKDYQQIEDSSQQTSYSLGLGLPIAQKLIELHGGSVEIQSEVGVGTTVCFSIPLSKKEHTSHSEITIPAPSAQLPFQQETRINRNPELQEQGENRIEVQESSFTQATLFKSSQNSESPKASILVVDDDYYNQLAIRNLLLLENYDVDCVSDGETALSYFSQGISYDLMIIDVIMPGISGYEVVRKLRKKYSLVDLPILLLSANSGPGDIEQGFIAGANDYVIKPFEASELKARVHTLTQFKRSAQELSMTQLSLLQAQIKPHFISNVISTISYLCYHYPTKAANLLSNFSNFLRKSVMIRQSYDYFLFVDEVEIIESYLSLERARFGDQIDIEIQIDESAFSCLIPPLMIQPLLENAIHHGVMQSKRRGKVKLTARKENNSLNVKVEDNGEGMPTESMELSNDFRTQSTQIGLSNIHHRLVILTGKGLEIESNQEGTSISFEVPQTKGKIP